MALRLRSPSSHDIHLFIQDCNWPPRQRRCCLGSGEARPLKASSPGSKSPNSDDRPAYWFGASLPFILELCSWTSRLALGSWQMDVICLTGHETRLPTTATTIASLHLLRSAILTVVNCRCLIILCAGAVRPPRPLRPGVYPLLLRTAVRL
jgi:hypothetical protein